MGRYSVITEFDGLCAGHIDMDNVANARTAPNDRERYQALERVMVSLSVGVPETVVLEQLERFAKEIMAAFKQTAKAPVLAG
jgi:hypothetical protein